MKAWHAVQQRMRQLLLDPEHKAAVLEEARRIHCRRMHLMCEGIIAACEVADPEVHWDEDATGSIDIVLPAGATIDVFPSEATEAGEKPRLVCLDGGLSAGELGPSGAGDPAEK